MKIIDLSGKVFGRWTVVARADSTSQGQAQWRVRCVCGNEKVLKSIMLRRGYTKSCGCLAKELLAKRNSLDNHRTTHGHSRRGRHSKAYSAWVNMRARCRGGNGPYARYHGRGITVDPRWESFENFLEDMGNPPPGMSLDRIDNNGNYSKENCRWTTQKVQARNRDKLVWVEINGEKLVLKDMVKKYSQMSYTGVLARLKDGWSVMDAILTPPDPSRQRFKS